MEVKWVTYTFITFVILKFITQIFLNIRNISHIRTHKDQVPEKFSTKISLEEHQKAAAYSISKANFGRVALIFSLCLTLFWTIGGGYSLVNNFILSHDFSSSSPIFNGILFFATFGLISSLIGLPLSAYDTFVVEAKHGFNRTTWGTFFSDFFKQLLLSALIGLPLLAVILWIMTKLGTKWWIYAWATMTGFQFLLLWAYPRFIAPLFNKFTELEEGDLKKKIEDLCHRINFSLKGLYVMDASKRSAHGNAYFTGLGKNKRIVFFDTLLNSLKPEEAEAVLAHELGHFKHKHILKGILLSLVSSFIGFFVLGIMYRWQAFYLGHGVETPTPYMALALFSTVAPIYSFFFTPFLSWYSRKNEYEADEFAAKHSSASDLINALVKLYKENASTLTPDPLYTLFYHSHPPAAQRVDHLSSLNR